MNLGKLLDHAIKELVDDLLVYRSMFNNENFVATDNLGEVLEKLVILHIRTWMLEDAVQTAKTDEELAELKRKIDYCFKIKRPKLIEAINLLMQDAITKNKSLAEGSLKHYKGLE